MMRIIECEQGSPEWFGHRCGLPTASEFSTILAKGKDGGTSLTRRDYMLRLAGEIITGEPQETYKNQYMERGNAMEAEARDLYSFMTDNEPVRVGFIVNGPKGCSPDSLIDTAGMLEVKTKTAHRMIDVLLKDEIPPEHKAQCQGNLWVAEREWIDVAIYWPKLPLFLKRAYRDEAYITTLAAGVDKFNEELAEMVDRIRRYSPQKVGKAA